MRYLFTLIIVLSVSISWSQTFSNNREKFIKEFDKLMRSSTSTNLSDFIDNKLTPMIAVPGNFPDDYFERMVSTSNMMIEKRHRAFPEVYNYVFSMYSLVKKNQSKESYEAWHESLDQLLDQRNPRRFREFIEVSGRFFSEDIVAVDPNFVWICRGGKYKFEYDKTAFIKFENTTLMCKTINRGAGKKEAKYSDSVKVEGTTGTVDLARQRWEGKNGKFYWEKVGLPKDKTFARIGNYRVSLRSTNFSCDSTWITTPYFEQEISGKISDRAKKGAVNSSIDLPYPQFSSYKAGFEIKNIIEDVDYEGGFSLEGGEFVGVGNSKTPAVLTFYRKGEPFVTTRSGQVRISEEQLRAPSGAFTMKLGLEDSITHSGLNVVYNIKDQELQFTRGSSGMSQAPFVNSYHALDMYVEQITWRRDSPELILGYNFSTSEQQRTARFESFDYYDERLYQEMQGMAATHPLVSLYNYAYKYDRFTMEEGKAATALNFTITQAKPRLLDLATQGFIAYDTEAGIVTVTPKTIHFVKAKAGKSDYDNISFASDLSPIRMDQLKDDPNAQKRQQQIRERNAERAKLDKYGVLDLGSLEMKMQAVDRIPISDSKRTSIYPDEDKVVIKKNRSIDFTGWINSGRWEVKLNDGNYSYEKNGFNILESDMAYFRAIPLKEEHGRRLIPLQSVIAGVKGELLVDDIENRSGLDGSFGNYPKLISKEKTKVFYDNKQIHLGAYEKERFYFEIDPFEFDSLLTFNDTLQRFGGTLISAGIFPPMKDSLKLMPDYSLGFSQKAPDNGYTFYGTEAKYENKILLSNNGLQGSGVIDFINSTSRSKRLFTFLPDSTVGVAEFENRPQEEGTQYPDAVGPDAYITFIPRSKVLKARSNNELISFFNDEAKLRGTTTIRESGMRGSGLMKLKGAKTMSENFKYTRWDMQADTCSFNLENKFMDEGQTEDPLAFKTENVNGDISFKDRKGVFKSNDGESTVEFPLNQYICKIDQFTWLMDSDEMTLEKNDSDDMEIEGNMDLVGPNFFSIHPKQDSLQFRSPKARFSLKEKTIYCSETEYIEVADARIFPDSMKVTIRKKAKMDPFDNAEIVANFITKYHKMTNVHAEITARRAYTAEGDYLYSEIDGKGYTIHMDEITLDTSYQTKASGSVPKEDTFKLSRQFDFYGDVSLRASNPLLHFDGATRINHECEKFERNWMAFSTDIDKENIQIPVSTDMKDLDGNSISAGIVWRNSKVMDSVRLYPTFLSSMVQESDPVVITSSGYLQYDANAKEYQIASKEKLVNRGAKGNYISLHTSSCSLNGDGKIDLGMDYGPSFKTEAVGVANYNQEKGETNLNVTLAITAPVDNKSFEDIGEKIVEIEGLNDADFSSTTLEQALVEWVDRKTADKIKSDYTLKKEFKNVPKPMEDKIVFTGLRLVSYEEFGDQQRGLKSSTDQAAIVNIFGEPVMKYVPVKLFAQQRTAVGDRMGLLMDVPGAYLYFFDYDYRKDGTLNILSSDKDFNETTKELKSDKKKAKDFMYQISNNSAYKSQFLRVFK
tara:strand:- start:4144 stop:8742 length:4599 start_codon:yes stop_codon:yes gene_type:complete